jgi:hypothetical protein
LLSCASAVVPLAQDPVFACPPPDSLVYDGKLRRVLMGSVSEKMKQNSVLAHDLFEQNPRFQEVLLQTPEELTHAKRFCSIEQFASAAVPEASFNDLYDEVLKVNGDVLKSSALSVSKSDKTGT